jgi:hypothetical protein
MTIAMKVASGKDMRMESGCFEQDCSAMVKLQLTSDTKVKTTEGQQSCLG